MKNIPLISCLFMFYISSAQNWAPIVSSNEYNYFSDSNFASASIIKTDSVTTLGTDSIFYLNSIVTQLNSTKALKNQQQFLQKKVISRSNGYVTFYGNMTFTLKVNTNQGDTWIFDSIQNLTATILYLKQDTLFGNTDSIKVITVSNSDTIYLSKNYGITYFKKTNENIFYSLKGIQNLNVGEHIPTFKDIFDFNIGDVFQYREQFSHLTMSVYNTYTNRFHYKITILSKSTSSNTTTYIAQKTSSDTLWAGFQNPYTISQQTTTITLTYIDSINHIANQYNHFRIKRDPQCWGSTYIPYGRELFFGYNLNFNCPIKTANNNYFVSWSNVHDTMVVYSLGQLGGCVLKTEYGNKFGEIYSYKVWENGSGGDDESKRILIGCQKNGVVYGTITDLEQYVGIEELSEVGIYPTFFSDKLNLTLKSKNRIIIFDILGKQMISLDITPQPSQKTESLNLNFLENGTYFISIIDENNKAITKKIIKID